MRPWLLIALLALGVPAGAQDTNVQVSEKHPVEDGQWNYVVTRSATPWACGESKRQLWREQASVHRRITQARPSRCTWRRAA